MFSRAFFLAGWPNLGFGFLSDNTTLGAPYLRSLQGRDAMPSMGFASNYASVKARVPLCDQPATHPSRKAREGWGTHFIVVPAEGWATRLRSGQPELSPPWPAAFEDRD